MNYEVIILSVIVSGIFAEVTGFSPAGLIVPGYFVLYIGSPERIIYTLGVAGLSYLVVKLLGEVAILYGRRAFIVTIFVSFIINTLVGFLPFLSSLPQLVGGLIGAIVAREFDKQGVWQSLLSLGLVMGLLLLVMQLYSGLMVAYE